MAICDYDTRTDYDLELQTGDQLEVLGNIAASENGFVLAKSTRGMGYVPINHIADIGSLKAEP